MPLPLAADMKKPGQVGHFTGKAEGSVAVACPFCHTMVRDGLNDTERGETIKVRDIAELVADSMETKTPAAPAPEPAPAQS